MSFQEALSVRSDFPECHLAYGRALEAVGRVREAIQHYLEYLNDPAALEQRQEVESHIDYLYRTLGRRESTAEMRAYREAKTSEYPALES